MPTRYYIRLPDPARARRDDRFDPNRVGLDHLSLGVGGRADLEAAARLCDQRGVTHGEIADLGAAFGLHVLMLEDPDGNKACICTWQSRD